MSKLHEHLEVPLPVIAVAFVGALAALAGGYWDDAWHTDRGRDEFLIAPHIAIYAGVALTGGALAFWALLAARRDGLRAVTTHKPLALAVVAVGATLASGPIDNVWHEAFGRDAVIWSPPHILGIAGTLALGAAIMIELARRDHRWAQRGGVVAGGLVLASAGFVTVEYDTDVPQFDEAFYLPVLGFAAAFALVLVRMGVRARWAATSAAAVYMAFIIAVSGFLAIVGFPGPALPLLVAPAVVLDLAATRRWSPVATAGSFTVVLHLAYVPARNLLGEGVRFDPADVALGLPLTWLAVLLVLSVAAGARPRTTVRATAAVIAASLLVLAPAALAHDPGQGDDAGTVALDVVVADGRRATVTAVLPASVCEESIPRALVARRAGEVLRASLVKQGCRVRGELVLPSRGRWFVYVELTRGGRIVESWLPVSVASGTTRASDGDRYAYFAPERAAGVTKTLAGATLYLAMLALLYATLTFVRAGSATRPRHSRGSGGRSQPRTQRPREPAVRRDLDGAVV